MPASHLRDQIRWAISLPCDELRMTQELINEAQAVGVTFTTEKSFDPDTNRHKVNVVALAGTPVTIVPVSVLDPRAIALFLRGDANPIATVWLGGQR